MSKNLIAGTIPESALGLHVILLGKTRSGKSSKARLIVEHCLERGDPVGIIDPKGDWWGIKLSATGRSAGFSVVIFGGEHADVKINETSGAQVAELVASGNRPFLIDLGGWMPSKRTRFFVDFASTFFVKTRGRRVLAIDEVHNFAPQGKVMDPESGKALHWANRLASEGGGKGITLVSASQRPQKVHKDYVTSHETLIACKVIHKLDRDAVKDWIDGCGDPEHGKEVFKTLGSLKRNEAWVWSPEIGFGPSLVNFPMFQTYDSFKPQDVGDAAKLKGWASVDLAEVNEKMAAVIEEENAKDPARLRSQLAKANAEIAALQKKTVATVDPAALVDAERKGFDRGYRDGIAAGRRHLVGIVKDARDDVAKRLIEAERLAEKAWDERIPSVPTKRTALVPAPPSAPAPARFFPAPAPGQSAGLSTSAQKMLAIIDENPPVRRSWSQIATLAGLKARGGSFNTAKKSLLDSGLLVEDGGLIRIANPSGAPATARSPLDMINMWAAKLTGSAPKIIRHLYDVGGEDTQSNVAESLAIQPRGGSWNSAWKVLRDNEIVTVSGGTAKLTELFLP